MTDNDRQAQKEAATGKLLSAYAKLVGMTAQEIADGGEAQRLTETVDAMTESIAKAMLIARIAADAVRANEILDERRQEAPLDDLGDERRSTDERNDRSSPGS